MTRERLYRAYIEELKFFNPVLQNKSSSDILADYREVSNFSDLTWIDIHYGPEIVGFVLVVTGSHCTADADYLIMETYIHPNYRGKGLMFRTIEHLFETNPGRCGMFILNQNMEAHKFWNQMLDGHSGITKLPALGKYDDMWCTYYLWQIGPKIARISKQ